MDPVSFFTILVWLAFAKGAVILAEDAAYAVRGKQSPRQRERAAHQAAERAAVAAGQPTPPPPGGAWGRAKAAVGGYLAGVAEDATAKARARKRRAQARRDGNRAIDGIFLDFEDEAGFYSDCDVCGWSSRRFRVEANALAAGREHTRAEHPEHFQHRPEIDDRPDPGTAGSPGTTGSDGEAGPQPAESRPRLRVIPGGARDDHAPQGARPDQDQQVAGGSGWDCSACGAGADGYASDELAWAAFEQHACRPADTVPAPAATLQDKQRARVLFGRCTHPSLTCDRLPFSGFSEMCLQHDVEVTGRCVFIKDSVSIDAVRCTARVLPGRIHCPEHDAVVRRLADPGPAPATDHEAACPTPQPSATDDDLMALAEATHDPGAGTPAGTGQQKNTTEGSTTVNLDATGPEEIRTAFSTAAATAGERAEEISGLAGVLAEAADRFEGLQMAPTTVEHMREASEAFQAAKALIDNAQESLQAALADFNAKDGHVADTVADTGGNLANQEVLVGG
ncbi:hypothetical protein [Actinoplanes sp. G11-F43]|uniref:hypothetical protein n=1 Tax=Actinoplanes sp. G11-F43 TaxID=3424130 RepID=UPI003D337B9B